MAPSYRQSAGSHTKRASGHPPRCRRTRRDPRRPGKRGTMATAADRKRPRGREADAGDDQERNRRLEPAEWRALTILGLPTFALALAITTVTTYLPVVASGFAASTVVIGRGAATCLALVAGGLLIGMATPVPFIAAAVVTALAMAAFAIALLRRGVPDDEGGKAEAPGEALRALRDAVAEEPALKTFLAANALWELSLAALKTFIVLYITRGLGLSVQAASLAIGAGALVILAASPVSGKLGDRVGRARVMRVGLWVYGLGMIVPLLTSSPWIVAAVVPFVAFGGGVIMTLPYALLMPLMPGDRHGALSGFYSLSRGIGTALGPLLAGVAIALGRDLFAGTQGFAAMWAVCAAATLASIPLARRLGDDVD